MTRRRTVALRRALGVISLVGIGLAGLVAGPVSAAEDETPPWDVAKPPGKSRSVKLDTRETTWSNVDVSPDGSWVVFDMLGDLYRVPLAGGEAEALTSGMAWDFQPRYSPDGSRIAFISDRGGADNLWIAEADGSDPRAVTEEREHLVHNPAWSPDGEYLVAKKGFTSTRSIPAGEIWMFHSGGGGGLQLIERPNGERDQKNIAEPSFSSDGRYVYFSQDVTTGRTWQYNKDSTGQIFAIQRLDRDTGKVETFVDGPGGALRPTPSPDGKYLAYVKRLPSFVSAIWVKDLVSGQEREVYAGLDRDLQEANGSQGNTPSIAWTPESSSIVFWAGGKIHRVALADGAATEIPVRVRVTKEIRPALRFPIEVAPDRFDVRMLRWAQMSPDGSRTLFQALGHIYVRNLESGVERRLTDHEHFEFYPAFSRDGRRVVYTTWDDARAGSVRVVSVDGRDSRVLTTEPGHYVEPSFAPDGNRVVFRKITGGYLLTGEWSLDPGLYVVGVDGGEPERISPDGTNPHFGAGGDRVFFSESVENTQRVLKSVNRAGHDEKTHLKGKTVTEFSVSPDGRWVAFTEQFNAYVAPFSSTGKTIDIGAKIKSLPVRQVSARSGEFLHWAADSSRLHWAHGSTLFSRELRDAFGFLDGAPAELPEPATDGLDLSFTVDADRPEGRIALTGGRVVTMRGARDGRQEILENGVVVVRGNRIEAVGPADRVRIPDGTRVVDVAGKTIVPGIVDVHAHGAMSRNEITPQQNWIQFSDLAFGVTTIHDPSNDTSSIFAAAELQRVGGMVAPRIFSTGTILYGAHVPGFTAAIESYEDAEFHVRRLKDVGAISVKSYQQPRRDQRQQVLTAARELEMLVVPEGGAKFQHNMNQVVDGHTGIEHAIPQIQAYDDVLQLWSATEVGYTPTFGVAYGGISGENYWYDRTDVWRNERLLRYTPRFVIEPRSMRRTRAPDEHYNHVHVARFAKTLRDRGVAVLVGAHGQREGLAAHWEMWMMEQGGFSPWETLRAATLDGAWYLGLDRDIGSLEPGKLADLVVIDGNPLEDLRRSEFVTHTMINGRLYLAETMAQIAPDEVERREFFFEREGGSTVHPATAIWLDELRQTHGWVH